MTEITARAVLDSGDVIAISRSKAYGDGLREAIARSKIPLYALDGRFSVQARFVVAPDPSVEKGIARQAAEFNIPVLSERETLDAISLLNTQVLAGWCDCAIPLVPVPMARSWEHHQFGTCGWPERRCDISAHRKSWCRVCRRTLRVRFCLCKSASEFTRDPDRDWWVHVECGWPTRAWFLASDSPIPISADGTPSWQRRVHQARSTVEMSVRPLNEVIQALDLQWTDRSVED